MGTMSLGGRVVFVIRVDSETVGKIRREVARASIGEKEGEILRFVSCRYLLSI